MMISAAIADAHGQQRGIAAPIVPVPSCLPTRLPLWARLGVIAAASLACWGAVLTTLYFSISLATS